MRVNHFSIQSNHLHLTVEARDGRALTRGMQGLAIRLAKNLNKLWDRSGKVWAERYYARILRTPREVRRALAYVLNNARHHGLWFPPRCWDPFSSGRWFDGWREPIRPAPAHESPCVAPRTWLQRLGWRRHGLVSLDEVPGGSRS